MSLGRIADHDRLREFELDIGNGRRIRVRRPTSLQYTSWRRLDPEEQLAKMLVGWSGVTRNDIDGGGSSEPEPFDAALAARWLGDDMTASALVISEVARRYAERMEQEEAAAKKSG